ncbi:hypothetical protein N9Z85_02415 [Akkermansiaceae bacterium]|jgi:hypothetical protein|nr:hypothetical protein [Akkermansiaceae bacterium]MDB4519760.1 hypothetical protein [Akkermansiaceae bacterium]|tara:strand:- start:5998 stop:6372 length:375 start_codon:yes stop_codon:yes gene_type:complete
MNTEDRDFGDQPLDTVLDGWTLTNHQVVEISPEQLTHKQVQRARTGRKLTLKMKQKLARSVNFAIWGRLTNEEREAYVEYFPKHLFSYNKGYNAQAGDLNEDRLVDLSKREVRRDFLRELGIES